MLVSVPYLGRRLDGSAAAVFVQRGFGIRCLGGVDGELVVTGLDSAVFGDCCGDGQLLRPGVRQGDDASAGERARCREYRLSNRRRTRESQRTGRSDAAVGGQGGFDGLESNAEVVLFPDGIEVEALTVFAAVPIVINEFAVEYTAGLILDGAAVAVFTPTDES